MSDISLSVQQKRDKAAEIINSLKGLSLENIREILNFYCPLALKNLEEKLVLN